MRHYTCDCAMAAKRKVVREILHVIDDGQVFGLNHDVPEEFMDRVRKLREELKRLRVEHDALAAQSVKAAPWPEDVAHQRHEARWPR